MMIGRQGMRFERAEDWYRAAAGTVFRRLREARRLSLRDFAEEVDAAHTTVYNVEQGDNTPGIELLARVAAACDLTLPALLDLIVDEMRRGRDDPSALPLGALVEAAASLSDAQRAETTRFIAWLRFRDEA